MDRDKIQEQRNRIFWLISDTILHVKGVEQEEQYAILCANLRLICIAETSFLLHCNANKNQLKILSYDCNGTLINNLNELNSKTASFSQNEIDMFKLRNISHGNENNIIRRFIPASHKHLEFTIDELYMKHKVYNISTIRDNGNIIIGIVFLSRSNRLKNMDLVGSYINLAGMIIQNKTSIQKLKDLNSTKDKFFSIIAHDLKNPFNSILCFSQILTENYHNLDDEKKIKYLDYIFRSSKHIYSLLDNLLQWARSQSDRVKINIQRISFNEIINENIMLQKINYEKKNIKIHNNIQHCEIIADYNMINTVIRNLLSNAIKFTPDDGKIILKSLIHHNKFIFTITDSGVGIKPEITKKLFRIDQSVTTQGTQGEDGTGLGLLICKDFIEKNNGKIWVESKLNKGTSFHFSLPVKNTLFK